MGRTVYIDDLSDPCMIDETTEVIEVNDDGIRKWAHFKTWAEFKTWVKREKSMIHYVGMRERPGVQVFGNLLETRYFWPPGSARNEQFHVHEAMWETIRWLIYSMPRKLERFAVRSAELASMAIKDTVPVVLTSDDIRGSIQDVMSPDYLHKHGRWFPLKDADIRTLEFANDTVAEMVSRAGQRFAMKAQEEFIEMNTRKACRAGKTN